MNEVLSITVDDPIAWVSACRSVTWLVQLCYAKMAKQIKVSLGDSSRLKTQEM